MYAHISDGTRKAVDQRLSTSRSRCVGERRPPALAEIGKQRELRNDQDRATDVDDRTVHLPVGIREHAHRNEFLCKSQHIRAGIGVDSTDKHEHSCPNGSDDITIHYDVRMCDPLYHCAHRSSIVVAQRQPTLADMLATIVLSVARGFVMGAADIVPGVSGGTVALIFGIYDRLIASIRAGALALGNLVKADFTEAGKWFGKVDWTFILSLGAGILLAVVSLASVLEVLLIDQAVLMSALFLGLVAGSIVITWQMIKTHSLSNLMIVAGVGVGVFMFLGFRSGTTEEAIAQIADPALWAFFGAGAIAICAMILPGISGSFLLVLMGMYAPVLAAVTSRDFVSLGVFLIGAVIGLGLFSQVLYKALATHHDAVLASLIGLMAGSMRVLWPWPFGVDSTALGTPDSYVVGSIALAVVAFVVVIVVARFAQRLEVLDTSG